MKLRSIAGLVVVSLALLRNSFGQDFVNLDFESANVFGYSPGVSDVPVSDALPGWTVYNGTNQQTLISYNVLGFIGVSLVGMSNFVISGNFSVSLTSDTPAASISQTGLVPVGTRSLFFEAQSPHVQEGFHNFLYVSLGGENLPFFTVSTNANYTLYGADISSFAGQTETLTFSASSPATGGLVWIIDNIQFSPSSVPEPNVFALSALGGLLFSFRRSN